MTPSADSRPDRANGRETPLRRQYEQLKAQHPDCLLLVHLGDFFEAFEQDARVLSRVCGVTLTSKEFGKGDRVPLAGVPLTRLDHYLALLVEAGVHVAVAEQVSPPGDGLVERVITRVVTPGTVAEPGLLRAKENNYLAAVIRDKLAVGLAYVDVTTGEFAVTQIAGDDVDVRLRAELERVGPAEVLLPDGQTLDVPGVGHLTVCQPWRFDEVSARERLAGQLGVLSLEGFGCAGLPLAVRAAGAIVHYLDENNRRLLPNLVDLRAYATAAGMVLDGYTRRNLEIFRNGRSGRTEGSLLGVLDRTRTPMGGRLLRRWLGQPLLDPVEIDARLDAVEALVQASDVRARLRAMLGHVGDLERRVGRIVQELAVPRELLDLAASLRAVAPLAELLGPRPDPETGPDTAENGPVPTGRAGPRLPAPILAALEPRLDLADLVTRAIAPPGSGRIIRPGFSPELDALVASTGLARRRIADLEATERQRTGIRSLKVGYNKVFGYYLEVTRPNLPHVPADYHRKQTLVHAERFITPDLKAWEGEIFEAEDRIAELEQQVYAGLLHDVAAQAPQLRRLASALGQLDVFADLSDLAHERSYCRPVVDRGPTLRIVEARHPVVEAGLEPGAFIPNDCQLGPEGATIMILTGPNMAGKSTYLREVALIVLLAQMGSFVPAREARIGLVDRVFTRVGAQDDIAAGASTFMVEMMETASILRQATGRSLIVLDEIGRGTSTFDGLSIARAVVEEIQQRLGARTMFATHFHELASLAIELPGARVFNVAVAEEGMDVVFLRKVVPGAADRSYGIHVARLAGLPPSVIERADLILRDLEAVRANDVVPEPGSESGFPLQLPLDGLGIPPATPADLLRDLLAVDPAALTPMEALNKIWELQRRAGRRS